MELAQLQKSFGVITSNAAVVLNPSDGLNNGFSIVVPPVTVILDSLIWIAHTDEHSIRTYLINNILESMSGEVTTCSEPNVDHEVVVNSLLCKTAAIFNNHVLLSMMIILHN